MKELNDGILYASLYNLIKKKHGIGVIIPKKALFSELGRHFLVPKNLRYAVIKEMEQRKMIKVEDKSSIVVLSCEFNLDKDVNKFYEMVGIYDSKDL